MDQLSKQQALMEKMFSTMNIQALPVSQTQDSQMPINATSRAHAVNLLATHIPEFNGTEDEDIDSWIQTIERVSMIHNVSEDVLLLAATGKLKGIARRWLDLNICTLVESWPKFRTAILIRFHNEVLFHLVYQKAENHKWNSFKESFQDYATEKIAILRRLKLPDVSVIQLLINGIEKSSLRETAATYRALPIEEFIAAVHQVAITSGESYKKPSLVPVKIPNTKSVDNSSVKDNNSSKDLLCVLSC